MKSLPYKTAAPRSSERPVRVSAARTAVRDVVKNWAGRTLRVQYTTDLVLAEQTLTKHEADLADHSPHALRLLLALRAELANRPA